MYGGFNRCLNDAEKFQSDTERKMSVILERDALKWFKPRKGQFQLYYKSGADQPEYQPDFVAETAAHTYMIETKARNEMTDDVVRAKQEVAVKYCSQASNHAKTYENGKPWKYLLVPHDVVAEIISLEFLGSQFGER